ncbi:MAG: four helix bundle protein [Bacteroidota bacterium]
MQDFRKLKVWEKAHLFVLEAYRTTKAFPKEELYGLTSQIRRAAASVPTNIAEGCGREGKNELNRFLKIAMGSASEVEYQILLTHDLEILNSKSHEELSIAVVEIKKMLASFIRKLNTDR